MPVVISSCSFGSESNSSAGNGVRSRMITTISLSAIAATRSAPSRCSETARTRTPASESQSAKDRATRW